jgi:hypothetical protein
MSHHGSMPPDMPDMPPEQRKVMSEAMAKLLGEFPDGKLNTNDEGALAVMIGVEGKSIVIRFPKPVAWIGFTPEQALGIAQSLIEHARKVGLSIPLVLRVGGEP